MNMEKFIHMQRYYKTIAIMLICSLLLTGCTTRNSGQEDDAEVKTSYEFNAVSRRYLKSQGVHIVKTDIII